LRNRYRRRPYENFRNSSGPFSASKASPLQRPKGLNSKILRSGHGWLSDAPQDDVRIAIQRSHGMLSGTAQLFDALDARPNFEPIMQSVRDPDKLDEREAPPHPFDKRPGGLFKDSKNDADTKIKGRNIQ
jgi:hypothetical protein